MLLVSSLAVMVYALVEFDLETESDDDYWRRRSDSHMASPVRRK